MKPKIDYKSKKTITIVAIAFVVLIAAIAGTVAFMKGNESAQAALTDELAATSTSVNNNQSTNEQVNNNEENVNTNENANVQSVQSENTESENVTTQNNISTINNNENTNITTEENSVNNENTENRNNLNLVQTNINNNIEDNNNEDVEDTTVETENTNVPNEEYTQTTVIPGGGDLKLVSEDEQIGWSPLSLQSLTSIANLGINKPQLETEKIAYVEENSNLESSNNTAVQKGDIITYVIKIKNAGNIDAKNIRISDNIPEGTELVNDSITNDGVITNSKISWKKDIYINETVEVSFKVKVISDEITLIENIAKVNGKDTNKTENPLIKTFKTAKLIKENEIITLNNKDIVKTGAKIRYTINVQNNSKYNATTKISDIVPEGTTLVKDSITKSGVLINKEIEGNTITQIEWENVQIDAKTTYEVSFDVMVNNNVTNTITNVAKVGEIETNKVENDVVSIDVIKSIYSLNELVLPEETLQEQTNVVVEIDDIVGYKIKVTNTGSIPLTNVKVTDKMKNGNSIFLNYNNPEETIENIKDGASIIAIEESLNVGDSKEYIVYYKVKADDVKFSENIIENIAKATGEYKDSKGITKKVENEDSQEIGVKDIPAITIEKLQSIDDKELEKIEKEVKVMPKTVIDYKIIVTNTGNTMQEDVLIKDSMNNNPNGDMREVEKITVKVNDKEREYTYNENGELNIGKLEIGESAIITASYKVQESDMDETNKVIENKVSVTTKTNKVDPENPEKLIEDKVEIETEIWKSDITVEKTGKVDDEEITKDTEKTVQYGDKIEYIITAQNNGNKKGKVTIKDIIQKDDVELSEDEIEVKIGNEDSFKIAQNDLEEGFEIELEANTKATIKFEVIVKAYAGTKISNIAYYDTEKNKDKQTQEVNIMVEDVLTIMPTVSTVTPVNIPQKAILVLDFSGSMKKEDVKTANNKKTTRIKALKSAVDTFLTNFLDGTNEVMIIKYGANANVVCEYTKDKKTAYNSIKNQSPSGGTNIDAALTLANSKIPEDGSNINVILMTDGVPGQYQDNETKNSVIVGDNGITYNDIAANEAIESAGWVKAKNIKMYSIGFGLSDLDGKKMLQTIATDKEYNKDGSVKNEYYYETFDGGALEEAFKNIFKSITTTTNKEPIPYDSKDGIVTITTGFKENQNIEIYIGTYNSESKPKETLAWSEIESNNYIEYSSNEIKFKLGKYLEENNLEANTVVTLRFIDPE